MKKVSKKCSFLLVLSTLILASCGNPHLVSDDAVVEGTVNIQEEQQTEKSLNQNVIHVVNAEGNDDINFGQLNLVIDANKVITLVSDSDKDIPLKMIIQKGDHFFFNGGKAPGLNGTCSAILLAHKSCTIDVGFQSSVVGLFEDNLIITNDNGLKLTVPLFGERVDVIAKPDQGKLTTASSLETVIDFGDIAKGSSAKKMIELNNSSDNDVKVVSYILSNPVFNVTSAGTCSTVIKPGKCTMEVTFTPTESKAYEAGLALKEDNDHQLSIKLIGRAHAEVACNDKAELKLIALKEALKSYDADALPYLSKSAKTTSKLGTLYGAQYNVAVPGVTLKSVKDAQVITTFSMAKEITDITDVEIQIDAFKLIADSFKDTELLCLSTKKFKRCSGRKFTLKEWLALDNTAFWNQVKFPVTDTFEEHLAKSEEKCGVSKCQFIRTSLSFKEIFKLTDAELQLLGKEKIINIIVADDTRLLSVPTLKIKTEVKKTCKL